MITKPAPTGSRTDDLEMALDVWDACHAGADEPEWRHILDEAAHPEIAEAFQRMAR
ncbi:hypothetical protein K7472_19625 [Streptomyces sp. PTM05]|uniref:Uncharacterized protein n=1 Tax=Streptantibioticus parmotrematis TaxID=2873249 RepID=A0ABS7QZ35_9ACTN|nr:hypothetical protein [Streptantibioticus parmotrematis]MBY8887042.1 hypothetical protein [Streptantibioticus parmotrematis]